MCGIFGVINKNAVAIDKDLVSKALSTLSHRGPDDEGVYFNSINSVALGHRRLSIIDVSPAGRQPLSNEDESIWLVLNGEIYNYESLTMDLKKRGHTFKSNSDTEVIIHLYEERGISCVSSLRGMFSFALWDSKKNQLFLVKDRVGKKPLFYFDNSKALVFSSELKSILLYNKNTASLNYNGLLQYLNYFYIAAPQTAFNEIKKLIPGHILSIKNGELKIERYWTPDYNNKINIDFTEAKKRVRELVIEAVKLRMISDVPVGAFISGGLDSSIVTGIMSSISSKPIKTFSVGFKNKELNELPYSRIIANHYRCDHHELVLNADCIEALPRLIENFGEPHADSSALATYCLSSLAKKYISVTLIGEGSDELFAGYKRYAFYRVLRRIQFLPDWFKTIFHLNLKPRYKKWIGVFPEPVKSNLFQATFLERCLGEDVDAELFKIMDYADRFKGVDSALYTDLNYFLPYDLLIKVDVATMSNGVEARAPYLDQQIIEFTGSLPENWKLHGRTFKYILKEAFKDLLPQKIMEREKTGFIVPVNHWFRNELKDYLRDILLSDKAKSRGYFNPKKVEELIGEHIKSKHNYGHQLWTLLIFELWHRIFVDRG